MPSSGSLINPGATPNLTNTPNSQRLGLPSNTSLSALSPANEEDPKPRLMQGGIRPSISLSAPAHSWSLPAEIDQFVIWKWNGTDASQFLQLSGDAMLSASQTMQGVPGDPALVMCGSAGGSSRGIWKITDLPNPMPPKYILYSIIEHNGAHAVTSGWAFYLQDANHFLSLAKASNGTSVVSYKQDGSSVISTASAGGWTCAANTNGTRLLATIVSSTSSLYCSVNKNFQFFGADTGDTEPNGFYWGSGAVGNTTNNFNNAGWQSGSTTGVGLIYNLLSGASANGKSTRITHLVILKHTDDWL